MNPYALLRPVLFSLDAERAHEFTLAGLSRLPPALIAAGLARIPADPRTVMGLTVPNPVGLAAGLDKNGECLDAWAAMGFGFVELGTVTPRPQPGNPRPRLFRLPKAEAIINRMGFNNHGIDALLARVAESGYRGVLGINIGKNADTPIERAVEDYLTGFAKAATRASYVTVNISSPNTRNLRSLQGENELDALLAALKTEQAHQAERNGRYTPFAVKVAPDLDMEQIGAMADAFRRHRVDAVIATNTTLARSGVEGLPHAEEGGGLSGRPLRNTATAVLQALHHKLAGEVPLIGVGGIFSGADARARQDAGAELVQLYTGLIYRGPGLIAECAAAMRR